MILRNPEGAAHGRGGGVPSGVLLSMGSLSRRFTRCPAGGRGCYGAQNGPVLWSAAATPDPRAHASRVYPSGFWSPVAICSHRADKLPFLPPVYSVFSRLVSR